MQEVKQSMLYLTVLIFVAWFVASTPCDEF